MRIEEMVADVGLWIRRGLLEATFVDGVRDGSVVEKAQPLLDRSVVVDIYVQRSTRTQNPIEFLDRSGWMVETMETIGAEYGIEAIVFVR